MTQLPYKDSANREIETRPMYVEEWLDSLPYIDFNKTSVLIEQALAATNQMDLKANTRMELNNLYHRPYQYYLESQLKTGAQHTLNTIDAMRGQTSIMKRIAVHLAFASKLAFDTSLAKDRSGNRGRPILPC